MRWVGSMAIVALLLAACGGEGPTGDVPAPSNAVDAAMNDAVPDVAALDEGGRPDVSDTGRSDDGTNDSDPGPAGATDLGPDDDGDTADAADAPDVPLPDEVLGLPLRMDGVLYAGAAAVDITPVLDPEHPVWMGGFSQGRAATGVHDPLWARALVLFRDREYVAFVVTDLIGLMAWRIDRMRTTLANDGFAFERVLVQATHNHDSPDTVGIWGPDRATSGIDPAY